MGAEGDGAGGHTGEGSDGSGRRMRGQGAKQACKQRRCLQPVCARSSAKPCPATQGTWLPQRGPVLSPLPRLLSKSRTSAWLQAEARGRAAAALLA